MDLASHRADDTRLPATLVDIEAEIFSAIDRMVLEVGAQLHRAYVEHPDLYEEWVETRLPFGLDKARRLRRIHLAFRHFDAATLARFPKPWQALYAISRLPPERVREAVAAGVVHPSMTVRESQEVARELSGRETKRFSEVDLLAGKLMGHPSAGLADDVRALLRAWLDGG
jgi:hypothetical protein